MVARLLAQELNQGDDIRGSPGVSHVYPSPKEVGTTVAGAVDDGSPFNSRKRGDRASARAVEAGLARFGRTVLGWDIERHRGR